MSNQNDSPKFKVGDKIKFLSGRNSQWIRPGAIGTIYAIENNNELFCKDWSSLTFSDMPSYGYYCYPHEAVLAIPEINEAKLKKVLNLK